MLNRQTRQSGRSMSLPMIETMEGRCMLSAAPVITAKVTDAAASETKADTATYTLTRTGSTAAALTVNIGLTGTAINGTDYKKVAATVTFAKGKATAAVVITPIDDARVEATETILLTLKAGTGYTVGTATALKSTIADNDYSLSSYFPTTVGKWWHYTGTSKAESGATAPADVYRYITSNFKIGNVMTTSMSTVASGKNLQVDYLTSSSKGMYFHQTIYFGSGINETQTYTAPMLVMPATFEIGTSHTSTAKYSATRSTGGHVTGTATCTMTVDAVQSVTVPFGKFSTVKVAMKETWKDADGWHGTYTQTYWLSKGIGVVKFNTAGTIANAKDTFSRSSNFALALAGWSK